MELQLFSVYDVKAQVYFAPFTMPTIGQAVRAFGDIANDPNSMVCRHPEDFLFFKIGTFEDSTAMVTPITPVLALGTALDHKRKAAPLVSAERLADVVQADVKNNSVEVLK